MTRKLIFVSYIALVLCMATATIVEKCYGTDFAHAHIYGSAWFVALWGVLAMAGMVYLFKRGIAHRPAVMLLHVSFVVILLGALTSFLTAERGTTYARMGEQQRYFECDNGEVKALPFSLELSDFEVVCYPGTDAPLDYRSTLRFGYGQEAVVSMNNVAQVSGYRFYQNSYDGDGKGVTLGVAHDPWGIGVSYFGYGMLLLSIFVMIASKKTKMRGLYRQATKAVSSKTVAVIAMLCMVSNVNAQHQTVGADMAEEFGRICVLWNGRVCPVNTVATDFVTKLSGKATWEGYSADEVLCSWMIFYSDWEQQPIIRIKDKKVQELLGIEGKWASYADFWDAHGGYKLQGALDEMRSGKLSASAAKGLREADEKVNIITMFYNGEMLKMFPVSSGHNKVEWHSPGSIDLPKDLTDKEFFFVKHAGDYLVEAMLAGNSSRASELMKKIRAYQLEKVGDALPSPFRLSMERALNDIVAVRWIVFLFLFIALVLCVADTCSWHIVSESFQLRLTTGVGVLNAFYLTAMLLLRWYVSGHAPLSNGYETMLFMSWVLVVLTLVAGRRFPFVLSLGLFSSTLCQLVAYMAGGNPQITPLMPVLQSPLLSIHVVTVMSAYSLFAIQLLIAIRHFFLSHKGQEAEAERATALSRLLLYPAVALLAVGIFIGAVWANVSWGNYWSWDPKETWALITMLVYAVPFHSESISWLKSSRAYHLYLLLSFLSVLITYFGVNLFLTGMHSYAG